MAKLVKNKKETSSKQTKASEPKKRATKKDKKAVDLEKSDDEQDDSEGTEEQEIPNDNGHNENRSTLLDDCDKAFGTHDLYKILDLDKSKATSTDSNTFFSNYLKSLTKNLLLISFIIS
jgi:hypothetical protein